MQLETVYHHRAADLGTHKGCPYGGVAGWKEMSTGPRIKNMRIVILLACEF